MTAPADAAAFCRDMHPRLVGALGLYLGDRGVAEELAQEALLRAASRWEQVGAMASPDGWTYTVAMNLARSWFRRRQAEARARRRHGPADGIHHDVDVAERQAVRDAVATLPDRQRAALVLRYFGGLDVAATADALGVSADAVKGLTKRALAELREQFQIEEVARG